MNQAARTSESGVGSGYLPELDVWRAVSVLLVVISHFIFKIHVDITYSVPFVSGFGAGLLGVDIFFFISGFVICRSLLNEEKGTLKVSLTNFYIRRIFRIAPALALYLMVIALLGSTGEILHTPRETFTAAAFACNLPHADCTWFTAHTWSLAFEEQFYLLFPAIFISVLGVRRRAVLWALFVTLVGLAFASHVLNWQGRVYGVSFSILVAGVLCAHYEEKVLGIAKWLPASLVWLAALTVAIPYFSHPGKAVTAMHYLTVHVCIAILLFRTIGATGMLGHVFRYAPLRYLGRISYGLYLWQQLFTASNEEVPWTYAFGLPMMVLIVVCSYHFFERPMIELGRSIIERRRARREVEG